MLVKFSACLKYSLGLIEGGQQSHFSIYVGEKKFEKKSCRKWNFSNPIGNPSQIEKLLMYTQKTEKYKKKNVFLLKFQIALKFFLEKI